MPIPGDPDAVLAAAEELTTSAKGLVGVHEGLVARSRTIASGWSGQAATATVEALDRHGAELRTAIDAVARSAAPLADYADALRAAQRDHALGEQMVGEGEASHATQTVTDGVNVMESARERALEANQVAARALAEATAGLAAIAPPPALGPVVGRDGTLGVGLVKAAGDVAGEAVDSVSGLATLLNPFSAGFGPAWATTWDTVTSTVTDPLGAGRAMVEGTVAPVGESYGTGGLDEAVGRAPAILAGVVGTKGLTKLLKLRRLRNETATPLAPDGGLQHHEDAGGHTLAPHKVHVGTDEEALLGRLRNSPYPIPSASSFYDRAVAERSVRENLAANAEAIDEWLQNSSKPNQFFDFEHRNKVGISLDREAASADEAVEVSRTRVVLRRDAGQLGGYFVLTSYPQR